MKPHFFHLCIPLLILVSGCTSVKRFSSATYGGQDDSLVGIELFGSSLTGSAPEVAGKTLWDLSASAQTQMIQILDERYGDNEHFTSALNSTYHMDDDFPVLDYSEKDLRMIFSIRKRRDYESLRGSSLSGRYSPADRIEYLKFSLRVPQEYGVRFKSWNRYSTEYGELDIADISFTRSFKVDLDAEPGDKSSLSAGRSVSREEEQSIRSRYLLLNGSISEYKIEIEAEGTREIDLSGNVIADVKLAFPPFPERITIPVFSGPDAGPAGEGRTGIQVPVKLDFRLVTVPGMERVPDTIHALLELEYVYRHVSKGWDTFQEWDDRVKYFSGKVSRKVPLFTREDILPELFCIGTERPGAVATGIVKPGKEEIRIVSPTGREQSLHFRSYSDAEHFFDWLSEELSGKGTTGWDRLVAHNQSQGKQDRPAGLETSQGKQDPPAGLEISQGTADRPVSIGGYTFVFRGKNLTEGQAFQDIQLRVLPVY